MITTKSELIYYLQQDALALRCKDKKRPNFFGDEVWKYQILLRKTEYYNNLYHRSKKQYILHYAWHRFRLYNYSVKLGFSIPLNVFGPGLSIAHRGTIVINHAAKIGKNCRIHECVTIGTTSGSSSAPQIGDNVFIGTGAKIIGDISIADNVAIGANAVVVKSILECGGTYVGVPAKKINNNTSRIHLSSALFD